MGGFQLKSGFWNFSRDPGTLRVFLLAHWCSNGIDRDKGRKLWWIILMHCVVYSIICISASKKFSTWKIFLHYFGYFSCNVYVLRVNYYVTFFGFVHHIIKHVSHDRVTAIISRFTEKENFLKISVPKNLFM